MSLRRRWLLPAVLLLLALVSCKRAPRGSRHFASQSLRMLGATNIFKAPLMSCAASRCSVALVQEGAFDYGLGNLDCGQPATTLLELDALGVTRSQQCLRGIVPRALMRADDGSTVIAGVRIAPPPHPGPDALIIRKLARGGATSWDRTFAFEGGDLTPQAGAIEPNTGRIVVTATLRGSADFGAGRVTRSGSSHVVLLFDANGQLLWSRAPEDCTCSSSATAASFMNDEVVIAGRSGGMLAYSTAVKAGTDQFSPRLFIARFSSLGTPLAIASFASGDVEVRSAIAAGSRVVIAGNARRAIELGAPICAGRQEFVAAFDVTTQGFVHAWSDCRPSSIDSGGVLVSEGSALVEAGSARVRSLDALTLFRWTPRGTVADRFEATTGATSVQVSAIGSPALHTILLVGTFEGVFRLGNSTLDASAAASMPNYARRAFVAVIRR